ncbi:uncharacterized protein LOC124261031 [Haliotis rubra]|uniref:uncharacterized protein LOC124261031 n=1 Tax=Haliotis rubra TaxID=36100 RepID=UPI001EE5C786|nr:uncharacterized protein LOC124261031 [Haliotis rubra]
MSATVVYKAGMEIGMTVDMKMFSCCQNIFSADERAKTSTVQRHNNVVKYSVIKKSSDVGKMLGISGDMSLKAKAGLIDVGGLGSYFEEDRSGDNVTEIIAKAQVETVTVSLDSDATPKADWSKNVQGTHYIRSITYGGDLFARIRIKGSDTQQKEDIEASVKGLGSYGLIDGKVKGQFKAMNQKISNFSEIEIEYFSTTQKSEMPRDIEGMLHALDTFKAEVEKLNDNKGVPCRCEIVPLSYLDSNVCAQVKASAYASQINSLEEKFDDVLTAKKKLHTFLQETEDDLGSDFEESARDLEKRIDNAHDCLLEAVSEIDVTSQQQTIDIVRKAIQKSSEMKKTAAGFRREVNTFVRVAAGLKI